MSDTGTVLFGETPIAYTIIRSARRQKTVEITIDPQEGVLVAAPESATDDQIQATVRRRAGWIVRATHQRALDVTPKRLVSGESVPYLGRQVRLFVEVGDVRHASAHFAHWTLTITVPIRIAEDARGPAVLRALQKWYRDRAARRLSAQIARWAPLIGCTPGDVHVRSQRARWASCAPDGSLRFNWRVIQLPLASIDYVVVHELTHLLVRPHSAAFWNHMQQVMPDYQRRRSMLRNPEQPIILMAIGPISD